MTTTTTTWDDILQRLLRAQTNAQHARDLARKARDTGQADLVAAYLDQATAYDLLAQSLYAQLPAESV